MISYGTPCMASAMLEKSRPCSSAAIRRKRLPGYPIPASPGDLDLDLDLDLVSGNRSWLERAIARGL